VVGTFDPPTHTWGMRRGSVPPGERRPGGLRILDLHASDDGLIWIDGERLRDGRSVQTAVLSDTFTRRIVLRSGPERQGGPVVWEAAAGDCIDVRAAFLSEHGYAPGSSADPYAPRAEKPVARPSLGVVLAPLVAAKRGCLEVFVSLYAVSRGAPADYDFPATREALKGHGELLAADFVEVDVRGKRVFGATVSSYDLAEKLARVIKAGVKGSSPQILCGRPRILRAVPMRPGAAP
jgi:hypothetical protein